MKRPSLIALALLFCLPACTAVRVEAVRSAEGYKPVIALDPKPFMQELTPAEVAEYQKLNAEARRKIEENVKALQEDSLKVRKAVGLYNVWAGAQNDLTAKALGLGGQSDGSRDAGAGGK